MCLIIDRPESIEIPDDLVWSALESNPHGWGVATPGAKGIKIAKGFTWKDLDETLADLGNAPALVHFRYATHGAKTLDNCHPFDCCDGRWAIAHNGMFPVKCTVADRSDTWHWVYGQAEPRLAKIGRKGSASAALSNLVPAGNRVAVMRSDGVTSRLGETWTEYGGLYLSNVYSLPYKSALYQTSQHANDFDLQDLAWMEREVIAAWCEEHPDQVAELIEDWFWSKR